jgi:MFS family permease
VTARAVLRHRSFVALLTGRSVSLAGNGLANIAITFAVLDLTGSATDLGLVLAARSVPQVVLLLFGGVIADRLPRHLVLVVSNLVCGLTQTVAATLLLTDNATVGALVAIEAVNGASSAFISRRVPACSRRLCRRASCSRPTRSSGCSRRRRWSPACRSAASW